MIAAGIPKAEALELIRKIRECDHPQPIDKMCCACGKYPICEGGIGLFGIRERSCDKCETAFCYDCTLYMYETGDRHEPKHCIQQLSPTECPVCGAKMIVQPE